MLRQSKASAIRYCTPDGLALLCCRGGSGSSLRRSSGPGSSTSPIGPSSRLSSRPKGLTTPLQVPLDMLKSMGGASKSGVLSKCLGS